MIAIRMIRNTLLTFYYLRNPQAIKALGISFFYTTHILFFIFRLIAHFYSFTCLIVNVIKNIAALISTIVAPVAVPR
jgi:hypothetical protein